MKVSFARQVKEEVVFNDFDICCQKAILSAIIKVNGTLSLSNQGLLLTIRTENAKIASKVHKIHIFKRTNEKNRPCFQGRPLC